VSEGVSRLLPVELTGPAGRIEGLLQEHEGADPALVALVCHPHPLYGGTLHNKVTHRVASTLHARGAAVLRFNFRGVGRSSGSFDQGAGETEDALAAVDWLTAQHPGLPLWLAGFSFGAYVALRAQSQRPVRKLVTVAPAVERFDAAAVVTPSMPWLLVQGDADDVVPPQAVLDWAAALTPPPRLAVLKGAGHFFHGRLNELRDAVVSGLTEG